MKYKNKKEVMEANLSEWERKVILENMEFEETLNDVGKFLFGDYLKMRRGLK